MHGSTINNYNRKISCPMQTRMYEHPTCGSSLRESACVHITFLLTGALGFGGRALHMNGISPGWAS